MQGAKFCIPVISPSTKIRNDSKNLPDFTIYAISDLKSSIQKFLVIKSQNINVFIWELRHKILALKDKKKKAIVDVYKQLQH